MFKVIFPMEMGTAREQIRDALPEGWVIVSNRKYENRFFIYKEYMLVRVGHLIAQKERVLIAVKEKTRYGSQFWVAFGNKFPELNPFCLRFGVVYLVNNKDVVLYGFDDLSDNLGEATALAHHYADKYSPFLIAYKKGDFHFKAQIKAQSYAKIYGAGLVGDVISSPRCFKLES